VTSEGFQLLNFVLNQSQLEKVGDIYRDELVNFVEVLRVFHPSSTFRALKSLMLFFSAFKETRFGRAATKSRDYYDA
jgi:hypothetical protein